VAAAAERCALPAENLTGWSEGMQQLQRLADQLNALDEQKGKYLTVSELKTAVFAIMQSLTAAVPLEEQLRELAALPKPVSPRCGEAVK
jgi:type VI secretion system protein VasL